MNGATGEFCHGSLLECGLHKSMNHADINICSLTYVHKTRQLTGWKYTQEMKYQVKLIDWLIDWLTDCWQIAALRWWMNFWSLLMFELVMNLQLMSSFLGLRVPKSTAWTTCFHTTQIDVGKPVWLWRPSVTAVALQIWLDVDLFLFNLFIEIHSYCLSVHQYVCLCSRRWVPSHIAWYRLGYFDNSRVTSRNLVQT